MSRRKFIFEMSVPATGRFSESRFAVKPEDAALAQANAVTTAPSPRTNPRDADAPGTRFRPLNEQ